MRSSRKQLVALTSMFSVVYLFPQSTLYQILTRLAKACFISHLCLSQKGMVIKMKRQNMAALYLRLSRDDGGDSESNSIQTQRLILQKFAKDNRLAVYSEYIEERSFYWNDPLQSTYKFVEDCNFLFSDFAFRTCGFADYDFVNQSQQHVTV